MKSLVFDQITYCADGSMSLKLRKVIEMDGEVVSDTPHRVTMLPEQTVAEVMAMVNEAMGREGYQPLAEGDITRSDEIRAIVLESPAVQARIEARQSIGIVP